MRRSVFGLISFLLLTLSFEISAEEKEFTAEQLALRSEIETFLKEEGFMPEVASDGDIAIKIEGTKYYISISKVDENPMYLSFFASFSNPSSYSPDVVLMATKELNRYKGVKVICYDKSFRISCDLYLRDAELFKESFYKLKSQMSSVQSVFLDECKNSSSSAGVLSISEIPFIITKMEVANVENDGTIIRNYGSTIYDFDSKYLKPRIYIKPFKTSGTYTIKVRLYKNNVLQRNTSTSPVNFTYSTTVNLNGESQQINYLTGWGSKNAGFWPQGSYRFEVWYDDYCIGSTTFKVI